MPNSSICPIDRTLSGSTTPGQSGQGTMVMKCYSTFPKTQRMEPYHQIIFCHGQETCWTTLQRCSQCILQTQPTRVSIYVGNHNFCGKIRSRSCNFCIYIFLHGLINQHLPPRFKISLRFTDDNIWFVEQNLTDQNPKQFKESFSSQIV